MKSQCCNPDMRYENPLYMAELAVMADLIAAVDCSWAWTST